VTSVTPEAFIQGMRQLAAGVTVVTTAGPDGRAGLTATSVCSVSAEPPQLLVCINRRADAHDVLCGSGAFVINLLSSAQQDVAEAFSGTGGLSGEARFKRGRWTRLVTGAPVLEPCLAAFDCRVVQMIPAATHTIFVGQVEAVRAQPELAPLVYVEGDFGLIAPFGPPDDG
jgi:flavin reductase (DIM6/NTAB) family NADH-FMN oxidoreductase RutF